MSSSSSLSDLEEEEQHPTTTSGPKDPISTSPTTLTKSKENGTNIPVSIAPKQPPVTRSTQTPQAKSPHQSSTTNRPKHKNKSKNHSWTREQRVLVYYLAQKHGTEMSVWPLIAKLFNRVFGTALEADSVRMQFTEHKRPRGSRVWKVILGDLGTEVGRREKVVAVERIRVAEDGLGMRNEEEEGEEGEEDEDGEALGLGEEEEEDDADMSEGDATTDEGSPISISSDEPTSDEIEASSTPFGVEPAFLSAPVAATLAETTDHASPTTTSGSPLPLPDHPSLATTKPASPNPSSHSHSHSPSPSLSPPPATAKGTNPYTPATPLTREEFRQLWNPCECTGWCTCPSSKFLERAKTAGEDGNKEGVGRGSSGGVGAAERTPAHLGAAALEHPLRQAGKSDCRGAC